MHMCFSVQSAIAMVPLPLYSNTIIKLLRNKEVVYLECPPSRQLTLSLSSLCGACRETLPVILASKGGGIRSRLQPE
jgi:hypothetical protein